MAGVFMYKPISKDEVLKLVKDRGPVIPIHLRKELDTDTILIGAVLSQLVEEGKVRVSRVKIGGSPTYYIPGAEAKLVDFMKYLNEKDRRAAELLRDRKILKDDDQDPLVRVCLRNIKDYAKPLEVNMKGKKEIFWKWFLLTTQDAEAMILKQLKPLKEKPIVKEEEKPQKRPVEEPKEEKEPLKETKKEESHKPKKEEKDVFKKTEREEKNPAPTPVDIKELPKKEEFQRLLGKPNVLLDEEKDPFFSQVRKYLESNDIAILDYKILKKSEIDLSILVPTRLGVQEYFCKAKNKKRISDGDLSSAYLQGQGTKLPIVFLTTGELTKKSKEMLSKDFKGMALKNIK
jgi:hypothetical protein